MLGEVRKHSKNGLYYVYEFHPDSERRAWLRLDTFIWGKWRDHPNKTTTPAMLRALTERQQKAIVRKYQRSRSAIESPKARRRASKGGTRTKTASKKRSNSCNSHSYSKCPKRCVSVRKSRKSRAYCRRR